MPSKCESRAKSAEGCAAPLCSDLRVRPRICGVLQFARFLQSLQERDHLLPLDRRQLQPEFVALDGARFFSGRKPLVRDVIRAGAPGIEHPFEVRRRAFVQIVPSVPDTFERGHFVIAGSLTGLQRQPWIGAHR